jgi:nonsense-mediated mRNA decay protein 3
MGDCIREMSGSEPSQRAGAPCPRCGDSLAPDAERADPEGVLCDECYLADVELVRVPAEITLTECRECGSIHRETGWESPEATDRVGLAVDAVTRALDVHRAADEVAWSVDPEPVDADAVRVHCQIEGRINDTPVRATPTVSVSVIEGTCERCGSIRADDYAATVQVRAAGRETTAVERERATDVADHVLADREQRDDRTAYVSAVDETDGGLNIRCSTPDLGRAVSSAIAEECHATVDTSRRLITEDGDGNRVYRMAYVVRLPAFQPGDVIDPEDDDGPVLVDRVGSRLHGRRLVSGAGYDGEPTDTDPRKVGNRSDAESTTLVAIEDEHSIQVLDPETYQTRSIPRPVDPETGERYTPEGDTVAVFKARSGLYVLPGEGEESVDGRGDTSEA